MTEFFYEAVFKRLKEKIIKRAADIDIPVPSVRHLIALKTLSGRPEDLRDIELLEKLYGKTKQGNKKRLSSERT